MLYNLNSVSKERWDFKLCKLTTLNSYILEQGTIEIQQRLMCTKCRKKWKLADNSFRDFQMLYNLNSISNERWAFKLCKFTTLTSDIVGQGINALLEKGHLTLKYSWILVIFKVFIDLFSEVSFWSVLSLLSLLSFDV